MNIIEEVRHLQEVQQFKKELEDLEYLVYSNLNWKRKNYEKTFAEIRKWYNRTIERIMKQYINK